MQGNRRSVDRVPVCIQSQIAIVHAEHEIRTSVYRGTVLNLSERGALMSIIMTHDDLNSLRRDEHFCPIMFENEPELQVGVVGRLVWFNGVDIGPDGFVNCRMGFSFDQSNDEALDRIEHFLDQRRPSV